MLNRRGYGYLLVAIVLAVIAGKWQNTYILQFADVISDVFTRLLKLISLPMISLSLLATMSNVGEQSLSGIGKRIVSYTILTTLIAASIALLFYSVFQPVSEMTTEQAMQVMANPSYLAELLKVIPDNLIQPFLDGNVVSIMLLSLLLGVGIAQLPKEQRLPLHQLLQSLFSIMMQLTRWIVKFMPIAVWAFMTSFVVQMINGESYSQLGWYLVTILVANLVQALIILPMFLAWHGIKVREAFIRMLPALSFAFFSKSSCAAMPTAIDCVEQHLNVDAKVARFSFPLCTSINMNACAAFILITVLFVAESSGVSLSLAQKLTWIIVATVAAIGNAGVPMGCYFIATALLTTMNLPSSALALMGVILPFYALLDMLESAINIWSDSCVTLAVNQKVLETNVSEVENIA